MNLDQPRIVVPLDHIFGADNAADMSKLLREFANSQAVSESS